MESAELEELSIGEKALWKDWVGRYPDTLVLSIEGREHIEDNAYDNYFANDRTFRDMKISDERLPPKEPIYAFWLGGQAVAVAHQDFEGGKVLNSRRHLKKTGLENVDLGDKRIVLFRSPGAAIFESTRAYLVPKKQLQEVQTISNWLPRESGAEPEGFEALGGFDTFWYNWVSVNPETVLLD